MNYQAATREEKRGNVIHIKLNLLNNLPPLIRATRNEPRLYINSVHVNITRNDNKMHCISNK